MSFKPVTHIIFDLDGLIIDSELINKKVIASIAADFGKEYTEEIRLKLMGSPDFITAKVAINEMALPCTIEEFLERYYTRINVLLQHPELMPGAKRFIQHLHKNNIPIAVATSSTKPFFDLKTQDHKDLMGLFHHIVCGGNDPEVKTGKPAPDIFLVCASRFSDQPHPEQCLVLEDAPNGAKAGIAAGMQVVLVPAPEVPEELRQPATLVINSLTEIQPELFGLPAFDTSLKKIDFTKMPLKKVSHVIFDLDGLIIESESIYKKVIGTIAADFGKEYTEEIHLKLMGTPEPMTAHIAITEMDLPYTIDEFLEVYLKRVEENLQHPELMPGAKELIHHLHKHYIPIAVATSSSGELFDLKTQDHKDLMKLFHHVVCGSSDPEVKNGKPAPDIFLVCASRFPDQPTPEQCLVFEDAPNGAKGGIAAGMQVVLVPAPQVPEELRQPATLVLESLTEFRPELFGLPAFESNSKRLDFCDLLQECE